MHVKALFENSLNISHLHQISWLTALFGVILPFKDKTQIKKSWRLKSCLTLVSEGVQSLVKLIQTMNEK